MSVVPLSLNGEAMNASNNPMDITASYTEAFPNFLCLHDGPRTSLGHLDTTASRTIIIARQYDRPLSDQYTIIFKTSRLFRVIVPPLSHQIRHVDIAGVRSYREERAGNTAQLEGCACLQYYQHRRMSLILIYFGHHIAVLEWYAAVMVRMRD